MRFPLSREKSTQNREITMYISRIVLDPKKPKTKLLLGEGYNPSQLHGCIESCFSGPRRRNLWRIDKVGDTYFVLIVSSEKTDFRKVRDQFGADSEMILTKEYDVYPEEPEGRSFLFRAVLNPAYTVNENGKAKKIYCRTADEIKNWFSAKAQCSGFTVEDIAVLHTDFVRFEKGKEQREIAFKRAVLEGRLTITNKDAFKKVLSCGMGREKAYGMGMLTVIPA